MAASENEFIQKRLETMVGSTTKQARIGIYDANVATLKTRYYLDFVRGVSEYDSNGNEITSRSGFIGGCVVGSDNYYMHNQNRIWSVGGFTQSNEVLFNDAGKNTLGPLNAISIKHAYANIVIVRVSGNAAWHVATTAHGLEIKKQSENWNQSHLADAGALSQRTVVTNQYLAIRRVLAKGDQINVRAFMTNAEGKYTFGNVLNYTIQNGNLQQVLSRFIPPNAQPCSEPQSTPMVMYSSEDYEYLQTFSSPTNTNTGVFIYKGEPFFNPVDSNGDFVKADEGFYRGLNGNYNHVFYVSNQGEVMRREVCTPVLPHLGYLSILFDISDPNNQGLDLFYSPDQTVNQTYTVSGSVQEYVSNSPAGAALSFSLSVAANTKNVTWNQKPTLTKQYNGKFRFVNTGVTPTGLGNITVRDEL